LNEYEGICVTMRDGWEAIIHYDETKYDVDAESVRTFLDGERYRSGQTLYGQIGMLTISEITLRLNPAKNNFGEINLEQLVDDFIKKIILPNRTPL